MARGGERVISRHHHRERATPPKMRGYPIYLTTSTIPKPKRPRGLIANRRLLSSLLPCTHYVPIMYNRYMYLLGFSWELNRQRWHAPHRRSVGITPPPLALLFHPYAWSVILTFIVCAKIFSFCVRKQIKVVSNFCKIAKLSLLSNNKCMY